MITRSVREIAEMLDAPILNESFAVGVVQGVSIDSRTITGNQLFIPLKGEKQNGHLYVNQAKEKGAMASLWQKDEPNPPSDIALIQVDDTLKALQKLAFLYRRQLTCKIVGITGSNGKTSTKDILAGMLSVKFKTQKTQGNYNNEIGVPLTLLSLDEDSDMAVVEMGMENLGEIDFLTEMVRPNHAIITSVGVAHLENLGSLENIAKAKCEIVNGIRKDGLFLYHGDNTYLRNEVSQIHKSTNYQIISFGEKETDDIRVENIHQTKDGVEFKTSLYDETFTVPLVGKIQALNALAPIALGKHLGFSAKEIQAGFYLVESTGLRNELVWINDCCILNDSYKSNPQSALAALETFETFTSPYKIAVLGDMLELGPTSPQLHFEVGNALKDFTLNELCTIGPMAKYMAEGCKYSCKDVLVNCFDTKEELNSYLKTFTEKDCMILIKASRGLALDTVVDELKK